MRGSSLRSPARNCCCQRKPKVQRCWAFFYTHFLRGRFLRRRRQIDQKYQTVIIGTWNRKKASRENSLYLSSLQDSSGGGSISSENKRSCSTATWRNSTG